MARPRTKYEGAQVETFKEQDPLWEDPDFSAYVEALQEDNKVSHFLIAIKDIFKALSTMHRDITRHAPDLKAMEKAAKQFEESSHEFVCDGVLARSASAWRGAPATCTGLQAVPCSFICRTFAKRTDRQRGREWALAGGCIHLGSLM
jgi:hypothetical protein